MTEAKELVDKNIDVLEAEAEDYKIKSYVRLYTINEIKEWIHKGMYVPLSIKTNNLKLDENNIIQLEENATSRSHDASLSDGMKLGLLIQNSWRYFISEIIGCCILPYEYPISEAWRSNSK